MTISRKALLLVGLPIAWSEWAMGRFGGQRGFNSCPGIFRAIWKSRASPYLGVLGLIVPVVIYMYYLWIESWCLGYALKYLTGSLSLGSEKAAYSEHFSSYVGIAADGAFFHQGLALPVVCLLACVALNFFIIYRGLSGGIEKVCLWGMPLLVLCALFVLVRVLTLGTPDPAHPERNVVAGLAQMWDIRGGLPGLLKSLANAEMWLAAAGQIFFSLSVGFGVIINYAPLWRLVPHHKTWQKECKSCWDKLVKGDYDWAHLAMHLWPERVVPKCAKDRSLAIAHGLDEVFWEEDEKGKPKPKKVSKETVESLIAERTSPSVKAALNDLLSAPAPAGGRKRERSSGRKKRTDKPSNLTLEL